MKLIANYHTHTKRCGHALGSDESYIEGAIELGLKELGFSDHVSFKDLDIPWMRQKRSDLEDYIESISALKEKYKEQIAIHIGFEAEYIPEYIDDYKDLLSHHKIEYLICGQHGFIEGNDMHFYNSHHHSEEYLVKYIDAVIAAMETGIFTYIAHPDHFMNGYHIWDEIAEREARRLLSAAERTNTPLEINVAGLRFAEYKHKTNAEGRPVEHRYPYPKFWELAREYRVRGIIGIDAHRKEDFLDGVEQEALEFAEKYHVNLITNLEIPEKI